MRWRFVVATAGVRFGRNILLIIIITYAAAWMVAGLLYNFLNIFKCAWSMVWSGGGGGGEKGACDRCIDGRTGSKRE